MTGWTPPPGDSVSDAPEDGDPIRFCHCGSAWFRATVALTVDNQLTGLADVRCVECDTGLILSSG